MGIRETYARKKLKKTESSIKRNPVIPDLNSIKKVGVIWQPEHNEAFHYLQDYFAKKQVIFRSLCFYSEDTIDNSDANSIVPKDLNWWGFPKPGKIDNFIEMKFDLLLNICLETTFALDYITLITEAKFKTGSTKSEKNYFDLNINIGENKDALYLAKQQIFYLGQLNQKQTK